MWSLVSALDIGLRIRADPQIFALDTKLVAGGTEAQVSIRCRIGQYTDGGKTWTLPRVKRVGCQYRRSQGVAVQHVLSIRR